ncbi:precorrin-6y C5,15-methyltransferase (decarboxylating) subunit CbiE [Roseibium suaedae]|uniref:Precorrin-6Y C5,15-methyltransferase (Decarboxylating) n=1 Tax=Roseibium suaedae TaxID=735517 RepID=A0A1M6ZRV3_9HYPH|nr:precorrin-6y C5,15-methyltransferase (decarboxylating) subunit CbiE [Roseibium suaedae]SHL33170.1 precorrin-6Y C5,15-methyltransferase (decarboxylating) [Roseibium suaedae]
MTRPWLTLIGIGEDGALGPAARDALNSAAVVYGSVRHFELASGFPGEARTWPSPFSAVYEALKALEGTPTAILATGDPQWYGIGASLARHLPAESMRVLPSPSAFQLAAARLHWPLQNVECLSIHGRPVETLNGFLHPGRRIIALTSNGEAPAQAAALLTRAGFGPSRLWVLEHMGGDREKVLQGTAESWKEARTADFNTLAIELATKPGAAIYSRAPGLPDEAFRHDGKMTKREVRAVTLAALSPRPGELLWDVGAGSGSIGIEWMRAATGAKAIGLEPHADRRAVAADNALALGTPGLELRDSAAPQGLDDLPEPNAIFIGGGLTSEGTVETCFNALRPGGRLVANAVTLEGEAVLLKAWQTYGGDLSRISVQRADPVGGLTGWRPMMPVTQWVLTKKEIHIP